jgi:hypothetical protein
MEYFFHRILIPLEKLNAESVLYWNMLCKHINDLGTDFDADLEKVLPNSNIYKKSSTCLV